MWGSSTMPKFRKNYSKNYSKNTIPRIQFQENAGTDRKTEKQDVRTDKPYFVGPFRQFQKYSSR